MILEEVNIMRKKNHDTVVNVPAEMDRCRVIGKHLAQQKAKEEKKK
jgi:hypothetical protein